MGEEERNEELQKILSEAFSNNSFDYVPMHSSLRKIYDNAFSSTLRFQRSLQGFTESQFFSNDDTHYKDDAENSEKGWTWDLIHPGNMYVDEHLNACIDYEFKFISVANREDFRRSKFYKSWFSFEDIIDNHRRTHTHLSSNTIDTEIRSIFTKIPILIIDNKVIFDYDIYIDRNYMKFRLPFKSDFVYRHERNMDEDRLIYVDHQITILMIDNTFWTKVDDLNLLKYENEFIPDKKIIRLPYDCFGDTIDFYKLYGTYPHDIQGRVGRYMAVINVDDTVYAPRINSPGLSPQERAEFKKEAQKAKALGSFLLDVDLNNDTKVFDIHLDDLTFEKMSNIGNGTFSITLVWFDNLHKHTFFDGNDYTISDGNNRCFLSVIQKDELVPYDMPIPVGNMFVVRTVPSRKDEVKSVRTILDRNIALENGDIGDDDIVYVVVENTYYVHRDNDWRILSDFFVDGGKSISKNDMTLEMHYPNIYRICDDRARKPGDKYEIYYFYHDDPVYRYKFTPLTAFYHYFLTYKLTPLAVTTGTISYVKSAFGGKRISIEEAVNLSLYKEIPKGGKLDTAPYKLSGIQRTNMKNLCVGRLNTACGTEFSEYFLKIFNYDPYEFIYGDVDFYHKFVSPIDVDDRYPIEYKIARMREWIRQDQEYLRTYVLEQKKLGTMYHLFTKDLDLDDYVRTNTLREVNPNIEDPDTDDTDLRDSEDLKSVGDNVFTFDEPMYVFSLYNENNDDDLPCVVFVDGLMCMQLYQFNVKDLTYLYIPVSMVTEDSYIEIEIRPHYSFSQDFTFSTIGDEKEITVLAPEEGIFPTIADMWIEDAHTIPSEEDLFDPETGTGHSVPYAVKRYDNTFFEVTAKYKNVKNRAYEINCDVDLSDYKESHKDSLNMEDKSHVSDDYEIDSDTNTEQNTNDEFECHIPSDIIDDVNKDKIDSTYRNWDVHNKPHGHTRFTRMMTFTIRPKSDEVVGIPLRLRFNKVADLLRVTMSHDGIPYLSLIDRDFKANTEYIRIFKDGRLLDRDIYDFMDGRLMPKEKYTFMSTYDHPRVVIYDYFSRGEIFYIDISPFRYKEIYHQEVLEPGKTIIDLSGIITKPFDYRYYDVYLNGRRLSLPNIISIDAWSITLVNLVTQYHLQIFEKERDWEYFGLNYEDKSIFFFSKEEIINSPFLTELDRKILLKKIIDDRAKEKDFNIYPNEDIEKELDFRDFASSYNMMVFYQSELIPKTYINPDTYQTEEGLMMDEYPVVFNAYKREDAKARTILLDPDTLADGKDKDGHGFDEHHTAELEDITTGDYPEGTIKSVDQIVQIVGQPDDFGDITEMLKQDIEISDKNLIGGDEDAD